MSLYSPERPDTTSRAGCPTLPVSRFRFRPARRRAAHASPPGPFAVRLPDNILRIWRLPALVACPAARDDRYLPETGHRSSGRGRQAAWTAAPHSGQRNGRRWAMARQLA
jgi:hypothetical protein